MKLLLAFGLFAMLMAPTVVAEPVYVEHHTPGDGTHEEHYFQQTGDGHHFAWFSATPATPGVITIKYDFRAQGGFANLITAGQKANALQALSDFSAATNGKLVFVQDTLAAASDIVNIGTGDLAALGSVSGPGGTLGLGGGGWTHINPGTHSLDTRVAWQDFAESWDDTIGNGNPVGTFDYYTVVAQEIGHAIGLGHTDNTGVLNIMNGNYSVEQTGFSPIDNDHVRTLYGSQVPEPATMTLLGVGLAAVIARRRKAA